MSRLGGGGRVRLVEVQLLPWSVRETQQSQELQMPNVPNLHFSLRNERTDEGDRSMGSSFRVHAQTPQLPQESCKEYKPD